jgi:hypothetical protein
MGGAGWFGCGFSGPVGGLVEDVAGRDVFHELGQAYLRVVLHKAAHKLPAGVPAGAGRRALGKIRGERPVGDELVGLLVVGREQQLVLDEEGPEVALVLPAPVELPGRKADADAVGQPGHGGLKEIQQPAVVDHLVEQDVVAPVFHRQPAAGLEHHVAHQMFGRGPAAAVLRDARPRIQRVAGTQVHVEGDEQNAVVQLHGMLIAQTRNIAVNIRQNGIGVIIQKVPVSPVQLFFDGGGVRELLLAGLCGFTQERVAYKFADLDKGEGVEGRHAKENGVFYGQTGQRCCQLGGIHPEQLLPVTVHAELRVGNGREVDMMAVVSPAAAGDQQGGQQQCEDGLVHVCKIYQPARNGILAGADSHYITAKSLFYCFRTEALQDLPAQAHVPEVALHVVGGAALRVVDVVQPPFIAHVEGEHEHVKAGTKLEAPDGILDVLLADRA